MSDTLEEEFKRYATATNLKGGVDATMLAEIQSGLVSVRTINEILKNLLEVSGQSQNAELIRAIAQLQLELATAEQSLAKAIREATALEIENTRLKERIVELESPSLEKLVFKNIGYYTAEKIGPYCPNCYEGKGEKSRLSEIANFYRCPKCNYKKLQ